jgi:flavin-binding protein dodecin
MPVTEMKDHVYKILELVGSSEKSIEDAMMIALDCDEGVGATLSFVRQE